VLRNRRHLAAKQPAERQVAPGGAIHRHHVHQLVVHQVGHPLAGREGLERKTQRRNAQRDPVARHGLG
jgi:hypothetical protein